MDSVEQIQWDCYHYWSLLGNKNNELVCQVCKYRAPTQCKEHVFKRPPGSNLASCRICDILEVDLEED